MKLFLSLGIFSFFLCGCGSTYSLSWQQPDNSSESCAPGYNASSPTNPPIQPYDNVNFQMANYYSPQTYTEYRVVSGKDSKGSFTYVQKVVTHR